MSHRVTSVYKLNGYRSFKDVSALKSDNFSIVFGKKISAAALNTKLHTSSHPMGINFADIASEHLNIEVCGGGFSGRILQHSNRDQVDFIEALGMEVLVAGTTDEMLFTQFSVRSQFAKSNEIHKTMLHEIDQIIDECFPKSMLYYIDLSTGRELQNSDWGRCYQHYDPEIIRWVNGHENRYLSLKNLGSLNQPHFVGLKGEEWS